MDITDPWSTRYPMGLQDGIDYYLDKHGNMVMTKKYHLERGYCCNSGCLHCPWRHKSEILKTLIKDR